MGGCSNCGDRNGGRDYIDRIHYICTGYAHVGMVDQYTPVFLPCETKHVDHQAKAEVEAEEREQLRNEELMEAVINGSGPVVYCGCGTRAIRRCVRCRADICNDDPRCCSWSVARNGWACRSCVAEIQREQRRAKEEKEAQERARYAALPRPTAAELAAYIDGDRDAIAGGRTHRVDDLTYRDLAAALVPLLGPGAGGAVWPAGSGAMNLLLPDGTLSTSASGRMDQHAKEPDARFSLSDAPRSADVRPLATFRAEQQREAAAKAAEERRRRAAAGRRRFFITLAKLLRPVLLFLPAALLLAGAVVSYRTGLSADWFGSKAPDWDASQILTVMVCAPLSLFVVPFGGLVLSNLLEERDFGLLFVLLLVAVLVVPAVMGGIFGGVTIAEVPFLQELAASSLGDWLVGQYLGWAP